MGNLSKPLQKVLLKKALHCHLVHLYLNTLLDFFMTSNNILKGSHMRNLCMYNAFILFKPSKETGRGRIQD